MVPEVITLEEMIDTKFEKYSGVGDRETLVIIHDESI